MDSDRHVNGNFAAALRGFLRDFNAYAGRRGLLAALLMALGAVFESLSLAFLVPLLGIVLGAGVPSGKFGRVAHDLFHQLGIERPFWQLAAMLGVFAVLMLVRAAVVSSRDLTAAKLRIGFTEAQRLRVIEALAAAPWSQIVRLQHARVMHVISSDIQRVSVVSLYLVQFAVSATLLIGQLALIVILAPALAAAALCLIALGVLAAIPVVRRARALGGEESLSQLSLMNLTTQLLGGLKMAIAENAQGRFVTEFRNTLQKLTRQQLRHIRNQSRSRVALSTLSAFVAGAVVLLGFGVFGVDAPTLIALLVVVSRTIGPIGQIQQSAQQFAHVLPAYENVKALDRELRSTPIPAEDRAPAPPLPQGPVVFQQVTYRHVAARETGEGGGVEGVGLTIEPGEFVGISGPSGAGKTTFADLLVGLYAPQQGRIVVAGAPLENSVLNAWRDQVSYIGQDPFVFHDTVRNNLAWANPQASEAEMWAALALTGVDALVRRMESGLDTVVGERGALVSGGERQRIALARAILRKPRLLVLDEATGAIDIEGEREILARLRALEARPTIVIVAHRSESLAFCDRIIRFESGRCVGEGAPQRLRVV